VCSSDLIDTLDDAIAVFSSKGTLRLSNAAFCALWKLDPSSSFAQISIRDALRQWKTLTHPSSFWSELRDYLSGSRDRSEWFSDVEMKSGARLKCRVTPLPSGETLLSFHSGHAHATQLQPAGQ
jgi:hypothetical protein